MVTSYHSFFKAQAQGSYDAMMLCAWCFRLRWTNKVEAGGVPFLYCKQDE